MAEKVKKGCRAGIFAGPKAAFFQDCRECRWGKDGSGKQNKETKDMNQKNKKLTLVLIVLCVVALAVAALFATGVIGGKKTPAGNEPAAETRDAVLPDGIVKDGDVVGQGATAFAFVIVDKEGNETAITVKTDKKMVGEALLDEKIVEGEMGDYGLYVKKVNGIEADYNVDQAYWAFYIDGEYAMTGVDVTEIAPGVTYMMKVEK